MNLLYAYGGIHRYCLDKRQYRTKGQARAACAAMETRYGHKFKIYRCPHCGGWHIGHKKVSTQ